MFGFAKKDKLIKDDLKGIAKLMYQDVSKDAWDQENLTKNNLDFSIESVRYLDQYTTRLIKGEYESDLLDTYFDNFVSRLGSYIGEVVKRGMDQDFQWYESDSVYRYSSNPDVEYRDAKIQTVLYSKKKDVVISPLLVVLQFLKGESQYPALLRYVEETIKKQS
ncbi:hypothetical protein [Bacillus sp. AK031]